MKLLSREYSGTGKEVERLAIATCHHQGYSLCSSGVEDRALAGLDELRQRIRTPTAPVLWNKTQTCRWSRETAALPPVVRLILIIDLILAEAAADQAIAELLPGDMALL
jgi:hypothetical protein